MSKDPKVHYIYQDAHKKVPDKLYKLDLSEVLELFPNGAEVENIVPSQLGLFMLMRKTRIPELVLMQVWAKKVFVDVEIRW